MKFTSVASLRLPPIDHCCVARSLLSVLQYAFCVVVVYLPLLSLRNSIDKFCGQRNFYSRQWCSLVVGAVSLWVSLKYFGMGKYP